MSSPQRRAGWATALAAIALLSLGSVVSTAGAASQAAQAEPPTELWKEYPLEPAPERRSAGATLPAASGPQSGSGIARDVLLAIFVLVAATLVARQFGRARLAPAFAAARKAGLSIAVPRPLLRRLSGPQAPPSRHLEFPKLGKQAQPLPLPPPVVPEPTPAPPELLIPHEWETCLIGWWRGYWKSDFYATATRPDGSEFVAARSPMFKWRDAEAPPAAGAALQAHEGLVERLVAGGWEADEGRGESWYELAFRRPHEDDGEPGSGEREF